jgi:hypothetical protein
MVGVMELASLTTCEKHERALLEKFAESMAATVLTVRTNERIKQLLVQSVAAANRRAARTRRRNAPEYGGAFCHARRNGQKGKRIPNTHSRARKAISRRTG